MSETAFLHIVLLRMLPCAPAGIDMTMLRSIRRDIEALEAGGFASEGVRQDKPE